MTTICPLLYNAKDLRDTGLKGQRCVNIWKPIAVKQAEGKYLLKLWELNYKHLYYTGRKKINKDLGRQMDKYRYFTE